MRFVFVVNLEAETTPAVEEAESAVSLDFILSVFLYFIVKILINPVSNMLSVHGLVIARENKSVYTYSSNKVRY